MMRMIDDGSMKLPAISSRRFASSRNPTTPRSFARIQSASAGGMFSLVRTKENSTALVMM